MYKAVQQLGDKISILRLDELDLPEEWRGVTLVMIGRPGGKPGTFDSPRRLYVDYDRMGPKDAPEPTQFVDGILRAAEEIRGNDGREVT